MSRTAGRVKSSGFYRALKGQLLHRAFARDCLYICVYDKSSESLQALNRKVERKPGSSRASPFGNASERAFFFVRLTRVFLLHPSPTIESAHFPACTRFVGDVGGAEDGICGMVEVLFFGDGLSVGIERFGE